MDNLGPRWVPAERGEHRIELGPYSAYVWPDGDGWMWRVGYDGCMRRYNTQPRASAATAAREALRAIERLALHAAEEARLNYVCVRDEGAGDDSR